MGQPPTEKLIGVFDQVLIFHAPKMVAYNRQYRRSKVLLCGTFTYNMLN